MTNDKANRLLHLVRQRRSEVPNGYLCVSHFHGGKYDCDYVSPWTNSAHNLDAEVMIVAQDWTSEEHLEKPFNPRLLELGYDEEFPTNSGLQALLLQHLGIEFSQTYATNAFPFIKPGKPGARIPPGDLVAAARKFALPQIAIVNPIMVICLGIGTFSAVRFALSEREESERRSKPLTWDEYERLPAETMCGNATIYAVTHLGAKGKIGRKERITPEWESLANRFRNFRR
jgi:hypothetical protein